MPYAKMTAMFKYPSQVFPCFGMKLLTYLPPPSCVCGAKAYLKLVSSHPNSGIKFGKVL